MVGMARGATTSCVVRRATTLDRIPRQGYVRVMDELKAHVARVAEALERLAESNLELARLRRELLIRQDRLLDRVDPLIEKLVDDATG